MPQKPVIKLTKQGECQYCSGHHNYVPDICGKKINDPKSTVCFVCTRKKDHTGPCIACVPGIKNIVAHNLTGREE